MQRLSLFATKLRPALSAFFFFFLLVCVCLAFALRLTRMRRLLTAVFASLRLLKQIIFVAVSFFANFSGSGRGRNVRDFGKPSRHP